MKLIKHRRRHELAVNMTPMIDVTFLLLIFFMTVNQVSNINKEQIPLPPLKGSQDQTEGALTVNIDRSGRIIVSGSDVSLAQLAALVGTELTKLENDPTRLTVVLRAHRDGTCRTVNEVVALLDKLNIGRVRIAVEVPT